MCSSLNSLLTLNYRVFKCKSLKFLSDNRAQQVFHSFTLSKSLTSSYQIVLRRMKIERKCLEPWSLKAKLKSVRACWLPASDAPFLVCCWFSGTWSFPVQASLKPPISTFQIWGLKLWTPCLAFPYPLFIREWQKKNATQYEIKVHIIRPLKMRLINESTGSLWYVLFSLYCSCILRWFCDSSCSDQQMPANTVESLWAYQVRACDSGFKKWILLVSQCYFYSVLCLLNPGD